ncbi:MAG: P-II family nitrogen regulator [Bacilli bacterium]|nr:P-II family nitrogen regulator [Bacilli bacterium]
MKAKNNKKTTKKVVKKVEKKTKPLADVIFCIVNRGFTDLVMVAARKAGVTGGTVLHARGTGSTKFKNFYGISVTPEKEIVMMIVASDLTEKVMLAINEAAGLDTPGQGIAFALPVTDYVGTRR